MTDNYNEDDHVSDDTWYYDGFFEGECDAEDGYECYPEQYFHESWSVEDRALFAKGYLVGYNNVMRDLD